MLSLRERSVGAATIEFQIVALFAMLPLCLGMLQTALLMAENQHVDHAAFLAARSAPMSQGSLDSARRAFAQATSVLYVDAVGDLNADNATAKVAQAYAAAMEDQARFARFIVLAPGADAQEDFAVRRGNQRVIPNDGLEYRSSVPGSRSGLTIQQANVLRLRASWCRPLVVPFVRNLLIGMLRRLDSESWHQYCYSQGRIPLNSETLVTMQSDFKVSS